MKKKTPVQLSDHFTYGRLLRFVLPSIIMMVFTSVYGVVDGWFVSNYVGKTPFAAINLVMPFLMVLGGVGFLFGTGGSALVGKTLGEQNQPRACSIFSMMVSVTVLVGIVISVLGFVFMPDIARMLGADAEMMADCVCYGRLIITFNTAFMLQNVFQSFLVTAEKPKLGLYVTVAAGFANMFLDWLLVGVLHRGVAGAALATGLSQCVGGLLPLVYFLRPNSSLLRMVRTRLEWRPIVQAMFNGVSELVSNITGSVVAMVYNIQLLRYAGEDGVAAWGVVMYVGFIFVAIFIGYAIGSAPIVSYQFGARNTSELRNLLKKSILLMIASGFTMCLLAELLARPMAALFVGYDPGLLDMTASCFRISSLGLLLTGFNIFSSSFFTALNNGGVSAAISFLRTFVFKLATVIGLPLLLGLSGIWWSDVSAEVAAFLISLAFLYARRREYQYF